MKLTSSILFAFLGTTALVTACSSSDSANGTPGAQSASTQALIKAICNQTQKCSPLEVQIEYGDVNNCVTVASVGVTNDLPGLSYTDATIQACADAVNAADCNTAFEDIPACQFKGTLAEGKACNDSTQCASGYCKTSGQDDPTNPTADCGVCTARAADGAACTESEGCNSGSQCDPTAHTCAPRPAKGAACTPTGPTCTGGSVCIKNVCSDAIADGAPCTATDDGSDDGCKQNSQCVSGVCHPVTDFVTVVDVGQTCGVDPTTQKQAICKYSSCIGAQGLQKCTAFAKSGEPCGDDTAGTSVTQTVPDCDPTLACQNGKCVAINATIVCQ